MGTVLLNFMIYISCFTASSYTKRACVLLFKTLARWIIIYKIRELKLTSESSMYNNTQSTQTFHWYCLYHKLDVQSYQSNYVVKRSHNEMKFDKNGFKNPSHDDVINWKHFPHYWPFVQEIHRSPVNSQHKGQWRGLLIFSLICVWING